MAVKFSARQHAGVPGKQWGVYNNMTNGWVSGETGKTKEAASKKAAELNRKAGPAKPKKKAHKAAFRD